MNAYFRVRVASAAAIERMTVETAATLIHTEINPKLSAMGTRVRDGITGAERQVLNAAASEPVGKHFIRLLAYRAHNHAAFGAAAKAAQARPTDGGACMALLMGNVVATALCMWNVAFPEQRRIMTATVDDEVLVVGWAWAMRALRDALTYPAEDDIPDAVLDAKACEDAERHARRAAALLGYLRLLAPAELTARFVPRAPVFCKEYVCRAYQALAVAAVHIARANRAAVLAGGCDFDPAIAAELIEASGTLDAGYRILKNEIGADDTGTELPGLYYNVATAVFAASRFYTARLHVPRPQSLRVLYDHMTGAEALDACAEMRTGMQQMARVVATMQDDVALRSSTASFFASIITPRATNQDSQMTLIARLRQMPALAPPDVAAAQFVPMAPDVLIFQSLCPAESLDKVEKNAT